MKCSLLKSLEPMGCLTLVFASVAWASPTFPGDIQTELGLKESPPQECSLCHKNGVTVASATTTPFALSMKARGLKKGSDASLKAALTKLAQDMVDSDFDGCTDIDELKMGEDPNVVSCGLDAGTTTPTPTLPSPRYGCGASVVPTVMAALSTFAVLLLTRRRRAAVRAGALGHDLRPG